MKKYNRLISIILLACMFLTIMPTNVLALELNALKAGNYKEEGFTSRKRASTEKIIGEITEKREKNVKYFLKEDMSLEAAIYNEAVHYYSEGKWKDIDNSFVEEKDKENEEVLSNKENQYKIKIAKKSTSKKLVKIKKDSYELSWNIENPSDVKSSVKDKKELNNLSENENKRTLKNLSSTVEFLNIFPDIDLQYIVKGEEVKENIILNKNIEEAKFTFVLNTKKLVPKLEKDNSIVFYDEADTSKAIFKMEAPFMYDAKGAESKDIKLELKEDKKDYILTIIPSAEWLSNEERLFPITLDPPIKTSLGVLDIKDTFVAANDTEIKYQNQLLRVGATTGIGTTRSYIKFTLPSNITSSDTVVGATLALLQESSNSGGGQVNVHAVTQNWTPENLVWSNKPNYNTIVEDYVPENRPNGRWVQWDITRLVKDWYKTGNNYGLMLKSNNEALGDVAFYSSDWGDQYTHIRPQAIINYVNNSGLESYWTYHSQDVGRAGTGYVNDFNGNLVFIHDDLTMNGNKMPLTLKHVFNSNERSSSMGYGLGWRLNLSQKLNL